MNPLDWNGEQFLNFYTTVTLVLLVVAKAWQYALNQPSDEPLDAELKLDTYHVAVLQHRQSAVRAAVAALVHAGALRVEQGVLEAVGKLPANAAPFERAVYAAVSGPVGQVAELNEAVARELAELEVGLRRRGLLMEPEVAARYGKYPKVLYFGVTLGLAVSKMAVGLSRGRPVGFLLLLLFFYGVLGLMVLGLGSAPRRTRKGDKALAKLRADHEALRTTAKADGAWGTMSSASVALAVALFGTGLLAASGMGGLRDYLVPPGSGGDVGFGGDSGGGDSGGGDGGGGCGGGGCGGCGGGGGD
ncbi:MAG TPA: TIGR04222 domain-containing membrane protein [Archangium sp.]